MRPLPDVCRRDFFKLSAKGAGLVIGFSVGSCTNQAPVRRIGDAFAPSLYLRISPEGGITIRVVEAEMGQGVWSSLPMLVAEELNVDLASVEVVQAPLVPEFRDNVTWGSASVRKAWMPMRRAGAMARQMLREAAATKWKVPVDQCDASDGTVVHRPTERTATYGELALAAADRPLPQHVSLKPPDEYRYIGVRSPALDAEAKSTGTTVFGIDVVLEGMLIATVAHCPVFGGHVKRFDEKGALRVPGVRNVVRIASGVAVVADDFWSAKKGRDALALEWEFGPGRALSSESIRTRYARAAVGDTHEILEETGEPPATDGRAAPSLAATYEAPFQAHATMEPMCCTANVRDDECEIWAPTQSPGRAQQVAARHLLSTPRRILERLKFEATGDSLERIRVNTTFLGGGFGRRAEQDFVAEAVQISQAVERPIKLIWTREEDIQHDFYRPYTHHRVAAGLDAAGHLTSWTHRIVGPDLYISTGGSELPYASAYVRREYVRMERDVPIGYWRSVGSSHNAFVRESFIDELAAQIGEDPYALRRRLLAGAPRLRHVLDLAAEQGRWGTSPEDRRGRGIAINVSHDTYVAHVVEVSCEPELRVHRVVCAVDAGQTINPNCVRAQMEGSVAFALSAAMKGSITIDEGRVQQSNFHDFPLLRFDEMPEIDVHVVQSRESPGGIGEPGVPSVAPAFANAVYAASGVRVRKLPITQKDLA